MRIVIQGRRLPGRTFRVAGVPVHDVHVGVQVGDAPEGLVPADVDQASWTLDVRVRQLDDGTYDWAGPGVHGRRGARFLYLTWGDGAGPHFNRFRRAKLQLSDVEPGIAARAVDAGELRATVDLTDAFGGPVCGTVKPPAIRWSVS